MGSIAKMVVFAGGLCYALPKSLIREDSGKIMLGLDIAKPPRHPAHVDLAPRNF